MKILHCCFSSVFADGYAYQDNMLSEQQHSAGHEVLVVTNRLIFNGGKLETVPAGECVMSSGLRVIRLNGSFMRSHPKYDKMRAFPGFKSILESFAPDVIFFHDLSSRELITVADYRRRHPETTLMVDSHAAAYNSATNALSKYVLHMGIYRSWFRRCRKYIDHVYSIGYYETLYLIDLLGIPESDIELLPLGGLLVAPEERARISARIRADLGFSGDEILFLHSGKLDPLKRTRELLAAFSAIPDERFRLVIVGFVPDDLSPVLENAIAADSRIRYIGWKNAAELAEYMTASDMYLQPGSASASLQTALCCGTPALIANHETYTHLFGDCEGVVYVSETNASGDIAAVLEDISAGRRDLRRMSEAAYAFAQENLDYAKQAEMIAQRGQS